VLVVNPAVRPDNAYVAMARRHGIRVTSEIELFLERARCRLVAVTGTTGKSTTAAMLTAILQSAGRTAHLGGNFGTSLLPLVDSLSASDWAVLELSSFQLAWLADATPLPPLGILTNFSPNHLDWHGSLAEYRRAKERLCGDPAAKLAVLDRNQPGLATWQLACGVQEQSPWPVAEIPPLTVRGDHNRHNAGLAAAAAQSVGCSVAAIRDGLAGFAGLPHRLEWVGRVAGRTFFNDSKATTPAATRAALDQFDGHVWLLAGGHAKGLDLSDLADAIARQSKGVACFGAAGPALGDLFRAAQATCAWHVTDTLPQALAWCWERSRPGDAVVLSPACASLDQYPDYRARGAHFVQLVRALAL